MPPLQEATGSSTPSPTFTTLSASSLHFDQVLEGQVRRQLYGIPTQTRPRGNPTNIHHEGEEVLVRSFDYGTGFEIVSQDEIREQGDEIKYYKVVIVEQIRPPKRKKIQGYSSGDIIYTSTGEAVQQF
jgi:hypothetical protein